MKQLISINIILLFLIFISSCNFKQYFSKSDNLIFNRDTIITSNKLRDSIFNNFIFYNDDNILDNIEASTINHVFKEKADYVEIDTFSSNIVNLKEKQETTFGYKFGKVENTGLTQYTITYKPNGKIETKIVPSNNLGKYQQYEYNYFYNETDKINQIICLNSKKEKLYTVSYSYNENGYLINENCELLIKEVENGTKSPSDKIRFKNSHEKFEFHRKQMLGIHLLESKNYRKTFRYNSSNQLTEAIKWTSDGNIENKYIFNYDQSGNIKERILYIKNYNDKTPLINSQTFVYQKSIELIYFSNANTVNYKLKYFYDDNYKLIEKRRINNQGNLDWKIVYKYIDNNLIDIDLQNWDKALNRKIIYDYENGVVKEKKLLGQNDDILLKMELIHDTKNNLLDQKLLNNKNELIFRFVFRYLDNLITEKTEYDNINEPKKMHKYDYLFY